MRPPKGTKSRKTTSRKAKPKPLTLDAGILRPSRAQGLPSMRPRDRLDWFMQALGLDPAKHPVPATLAEVHAQVAAFEQEYRQRCQSGAVPPQQSMLATLYRVSARLNDVAAKRQPSLNLVPVPRTQPAPAAETGHFGIWPYHEQDDEARRQGGLPGAYHAALVGNDNLEP